MKNLSRHQSPREIRRGFTLTELLVVILIIAILAALSMIGVQRIKQIADKATSTRNLSQLQTANAAYAIDHNGRYVSIRVNDSKGTPTRWFQNREFVANLIGDVMDNSGEQATTIPLQMLDPKVVRAREPLYDRLYCSYGMNDTGLPLGNDPNLNSSHTTNTVADPARSMAFATATDFRVNYNSRLKWDFENPKDAKTGDGAMAYRHGDKALAVYFDGHVGEISAGDMKEIDKKGAKSNAFWNP